MELIIGIVGWTGTILLLGAYALLTARKLSASGAVYQSLNLIGGLALMVNTAYYSAWPSAVLNLVWFGIGLVGLIRSKQQAANPQLAGDGIER
ncbi:MAG: CBU_0592 family membrane protein [Candidatus Nanopelagicales bacterium]